MPKTAQGFFVSGTGTDVGKTFVSAFISRLVSLLPIRSAYFKPIQCGPAFLGEQIVIEEGDAGLVRRLGGEKCEIATPTYLLETPASPHLAFKMEDKEFRLEEYQKSIVALRRDYDFVICEGAGGLRVPVNDKLDMSDLARESHFPVLVVAQPGLGTLNHTLLTLESLVHRRIPVAGFVFSIANDGWDWKKDVIVQDNIRTLERWGHVPFLGFVPHLESGAWEDEEELRQHPLYQWIERRV
jgi:dethiobiotin synthetase